MALLLEGLEVLKLIAEGSENRKAGVVVLSVSWQELHFSWRSNGRLVRRCGAAAEPQATRLGNQSVESNAWPCLYDRCSL